MDENISSNRRLLKPRQKLSSLSMQAAIAKLDQKRTSEGTKDLA